MSAPSPGRPGTARLSSGSTTEVEFAWPPSERTKFIEAAALAALLPRAEHTTVYTAAIRKLEKKTSSTDTGWRKLPGRAERELAETVAFVAGAEGGVCEAAVGVEEGAEEVVLRLAMTEGVPERVREGLEKVLEVVKADGSERDTRAVVLERILGLHTPTIAGEVQRRWHHGLARMFVETMAANDEFGSLVSADSASVNSTDMGSAEDILEMLYQRFQGVFSLAEQDVECEAEVRKLVETCFRARKSRLFKTFMNLPSRAVIWTMIETFAQYKSAAHTLVSLARLHPTALQTLTLQTLGTPLREALPPPENSDSGLTQVAASLLVDTPFDVASAKVQMLTGLSPETLLSKYEELYLSRLTIHAEMQLVKFYEENPAVTTPVFMGTSQPSCYLCARFLSGYGSLAVSKSTSTVHPRWTLPRMECRSQHAVEALTTIVDEMAREVEEGCRVVLAHDDYREVVRSRGASASQAGTATPTRLGAASSINMSRRSSRNSSPARSERESRLEVGASSSRASTRARARESRPQSVLESAVYRAVSELKPEEVVSRRNSERARSRDSDIAHPTTREPETVLSARDRSPKHDIDEVRDASPAPETPLSAPCRSPGIREGSVIMAPESAVSRKSRRMKSRSRSRSRSHARSERAQSVRDEPESTVSKRSMRGGHDEVRESSATRTESRRDERREERAATILSDGGNDSMVSRKSRKKSSRDHEERTRYRSHHHEERRVRDSSQHHEDIAAATVLSACDTESGQSMHKNVHHHHHKERSRSRSQSRHKNLHPHHHKERSRSRSQSMHKNLHHHKERSRSRPRSRSRHHKGRAAPAVLSDQDGESVVFKKLKHKSSRHHKERSRSRSRSRSKSRLRKERASKTSHHHEEKIRQSSHHHEETAATVLSNRDNESRASKHKSSRHHKERSKSRSRSKSRHHDRKASQNHEEKTRESPHHEETAAAVLLDRDNESRKLRHKSSRHHKERSRSRSRSISKSRRHDRKASITSHHHAERTREASVARSATRARDSSSRPQSVREASVPPESAVSKHKSSRHHEERTREASVARSSTRARDVSSRPQSVREASVPPESAVSKHKSSRHHEERTRGQALLSDWGKDSTVHENKSSSHHETKDKETSHHHHRHHEEKARESSAARTSSRARGRSSRPQSVRESSVPPESTVSRMSRDTRDASTREESVSRMSRHNSERDASVREESVAHSTRSKHRSSQPESIREESIPRSTRSQHRSSHAGSVREESVARSTGSKHRSSRPQSVREESLPRSVVSTKEKSRSLSAQDNGVVVAESGRTKERTTRSQPIPRTGTMPSVPEASDSEEITYGSVVNSSSNPRKALVAAIYSQLSPRHKRPAASRMSTVDGGVPLVTPAKERSGPILEKSAVIENVDETLETSTSRALETPDVALQSPTGAEAQQRERVQAHSVASSATSLGLFRSDSRDSAITAPVYGRTHLRNPAPVSGHEVPISPPRRTITTNPSAFLPAPPPPLPELVPPPASARKTPLRGPLELTIERNTPTLADALHKMRGAPPQPEYTIYLAGHYAEGLDVGDQMFSGKVTTRESRSRKVQCKGFQIRSSLREKGTGSEHPRGKDVGPLTVQEVTKGDELTVLDISFTDAVVRLEVFWDV